MLIFLFSNAYSPDRKYQALSLSKMSELQVQGYKPFQTHFIHFLLIYLRKLLLSEYSLLIHTFQTSADLTKDIIFIILLPPFKTIQKLTKHTYFL